MIGRNLHREFEHGAKRGSLVADCQRIARNRVRCYISFRDSFGDPWCGTASVRERRPFYGYFWRLREC